MTEKKRSPEEAGGDDKMEIEQAEKPVAKQAPKEKTPTEIYLEKLTKTLTRDFPRGTQGEIASLARAVESIYFYRKEGQKLSSEGLAAVDYITRIFTNQTKKEPFNPSLPPAQAVNSLKQTVESLNKTLESFNKSADPQACFIECASFLALLSVLTLTDNSEDNVQFGYTQFTLLWETLMRINRRSADLIAAKVCFYRILFHGKLKQSNHAIRTSLLKDYRTCVLNHNEPCQATLTNIILQKYLEDNLISQAAKFSTKVVIPERSDPYQIARYSYYVGRINVVQLQYGDALSSFRQALRKAPVERAIGFKQMVTKYFVVTMLLMGDIPERSIFRQEGMIDSLQPYFQLTQAVRIGDMKLFTDTVDTHSDKFESDGVYMLITRLRHNVIKAALRKISVSYSRINLCDIAQKLNLANALEAEYIVAKAIRDGVIDAIIDHRTQQMRSTEVASVYATTNPQHMLDNRIQYCLQLHQQCVKAYRYKQDEDEEEPKKEGDEDDRDIEEIAKEIAKELEEDEDDE